MKQYRVIFLCAGLVLRLDVKKEKYRLDSFEVVQMILSKLLSPTMSTTFTFGRRNSGLGDFKFIVLYLMY